MEKHPFRDYHVICLMKEYDPDRGALDRYLHSYFRHHRALGSKDRREISTHVYRLVRWKGLIDYCLGSSASWEQRLSFLQSRDFEHALRNSDIPLLHRLSCPLDLWEALVRSHGEEVAEDICIANNEQAPVTLRVNTLKVDRDTLLRRMGSWVDVQPTSFSQEGISLKERRNLFSSAEFREGLFEVQDEGSQLIASLVQASPGDQILDFCAGSGGKALAIAPRLKKRGQLYLHDIRWNALLEARQRLKRAGVQNAQLLKQDSPHFSRLRKRMDWVFVDAPCSGTGTYRRNPDMKWKFSLETVQRLVGEQRKIFEKALSFVSEKGRIVYATCSVLREENQDQLEHFLSTYDLEVEGEPFQSLPSLGGMDGFYAVVLRRSNRKR